MTYPDLNEKKIEVYACTYRDHFTCGRKNSTARCEQYRSGQPLKGLFHECKSNRAGGPDRTNAGTHPRQ